MKTFTRCLCLVLALTMAGQSVPVKADATAPNLSLDDLGFSKSQTQGDAKLQETLHRRSKMLKYHQILGLATLVPMFLAVSSGDGIEEKTSRRRHAALGITTATMYFTTASFALFAPEGPSDKKNVGLTRIHKALAFIHFPAMVAAPILGYEAKRQMDRGQTVHGIAKYHKTAVGAAVGAYTAAMLVMVFNF